MTYYKTKYHGYLVSKDGHIINTNTHHNCKKRVKSHSDKDGYYKVVLRVNKKAIHKRLHIIVLETFIKKPSIDHVVNHKNGIKTDNRLDNLEWLLPADNERHARNVLGKRLLGEKCSRSKLKTKDILEIRSLNKLGLKNWEIASIFSVGNMQISRILKGEHWSHVR